MPGEGLIIAETLASQLAGGTPGLLSPISFCHWQPDETTNVGRGVWTSIFAAAQVSLALYNAIQQDKIKQKQLDLAEKWYSHADYKWNRFRDRYMPLEKKLLNEVSNKQVPKLNCADAERRAETSTYSAYNIMDRYFRQKVKLYQCCLDDSFITDMNINRSAMLVDSENYNYADDRWFRDYKDDQRWNRRSQVLDLGRNLSKMAMEYGSIANQIYGAVGAQYDRMAGSAMQALGYFGARNDTYMPHTYFGTAGHGIGGLVNIHSQPGGISPTGINPTGTGIGEP